MPEMTDAARGRMEARQKAAYDENVATLARWAGEASGGVLTFLAPAYGKGHLYRNPSLCRVDGEPLGFHESFGERTAVTGVQIRVFADGRRLTRRDRRTMRAIHDAIRTMFYGSADSSYSQVRADFDRADVAVALGAFAARNHLEDVTP